MANLYGLFKDLIPATPLVIGTVAVSSGDTHQIDLLGGGVIMVRGKASVGERVFVRNGVIEGVAPLLDFVECEV